MNATTAHITANRLTARTGDPCRASAVRTRSQAARTRIPAAIAVFVAVAVFLGCAGALPTLADRVTQPVSIRTVRVEGMDTLWSIARANRQAGLSTAETVSLILRLNGRSSSGGLHAGDTLAVPSREAADAAMAMR